MAVLRGIFGVAWKGRFLGWFLGWFLGAKIDALKGALLMALSRGRGRSPLRPVSKSPLFTPT